MTSTRLTRAARGVAALGFLGTALLAGCSDDATDVVTTQPPGDASVTTTSSAPAAPGLAITGAWARNSPAVATRGAVYFVIENSGDTDDALIAGAVDASVAGAVELHETVAVQPGDAMDPQDAPAMTPTTGAMDPGAGMMQMRPVESIPVAAGATVALEPGGLHVMLIDLVEPLEVGETIELTLTFEVAGEMVVTAEVREMAP